MSSLADTPQGQSRSTTGRVFHKYLRRKNELAAPWSVAELELTDSDFAELKAWLLSFEQKMIVEAHNQGWSRSLDPNKKYTNSVVCGFLLHLLYAEHVRRFGSEGNYWGCVSKLDWTAYDRHLLFNSNSQPTQFHRDLLQKSAQQLKMRHAFGVEGTPQWFSTGYLQFGFTKKGFLTRLPEWLSTPLHSTTAIETLCSDSSTGSSSFKKLWGSLSDYRRNLISEGTLRARLNSSFWILPDWHNDILATAKKRAHLGTDTGYAKTDDLYDTFLSSPKLIFTNQGSPEFQLEIINVADLPLTAPEYRIVLNGDTKLRLIQQQDGSYIPTTHAPLAIPFTTNEVNSSLEDATTGALITSQNLICWSPDELLCAFKSDGTRYPDPTSLKTGNQDQLYILFPSALENTTNPQPLSTWISPNGQWTIAEVSSSASFELSYEGDLVWSLDEARMTNSAEREVLRESVTATAEPVEISSGLLFTTIEIDLEPIPGCEVQLDWARIGIEKLKFDQGTLRAPWQVSPENLSQGLNIQCSISVNGQSLRQRIHLEIPFQGAIWLHRGTYRLNPPRVLLTRETEQSSVRINPESLGPTDRLTDCAIIEGSRLVRRLRPGPISLGKLTGMGAPLELWSDLFNQRKVNQRLADAVIDGGLIKQVFIDQESIVITPTPGALLRADFGFYAWVGSQSTPMQIASISASEEDTEFGTKAWRVANDWQHESISAIAVFFEDNCIGSWWNLKNWTIPLHHCASDEYASDYAEVIRLFRCPILYDETKKWVQDYCRQHLDAILPRWLTLELTRELPGGRHISVQAEHNEAWHRAVGSILGVFNTKLDLATANLIVETLQPDEQTEIVRIIRVAYSLIRVSPPLACEVISTWLEQYALPTHGRGTARKLQSSICEALKPQQTEVEDFCENVSRVDEFFLTGHCQKFAENWPHLQPANVRNLRLLFQHELPRLLATEKRLRRIHL